MLVQLQQQIPASKVVLGRIRPVRNFEVWDFWRVWGLGLEENMTFEDWFFPDLGQAQWARKLKNA